MLSTTTQGGRVVLPAALANHRTCTADVEVVVRREGVRATTSPARPDDGVWCGNEGGERGENSVVAAGAPVPVSAMRLPGRGDAPRRCWIRESIRLWCVQP